MLPFKFWQSVLRFGRSFHLKNFKTAAVAAISDIVTERNSESLCLPSSFGSSNLRYWRRCRLKNFKMSAMASCISERNDFSNFEFLCHCDASHEVSAQYDLRFLRRCCLKNFKTAAMAILDIRTKQFLQF